MTDLDPTEQALLCGIITHPHEDVARLVYADWLDEHAEPPKRCPKCKGLRFRSSAKGRIHHDQPCPTCRGTGTVSDGRAERAEFIRLQIRMELMRSECMCGACVTRRGEHQHHNGHCVVNRRHDDGVHPLNRERELLGVYGRQWARVPWRGAGAFDRRDSPEANFAAPTYTFRRGFVGRVECPALSWVCGRYVAESVYGHSPEYAWRVTPWALAVASTHPVTEFVIGDREPWEIEGQQDRSHPWVWRPEDGVGGERERLIRPLFNAIKAPRKTIHGAYYPTREQALDALATAAADVVREAVASAWAKEGRT
jgi:uncharacterized protein (TIGR02996 family)